MNIIKRFHTAIQESLARPVPAAAFDRRSLPIYCGLAMVLSIQLLALTLSDFYLGGIRAVVMLLYMGFLIAVALYLRRRHLERVSLIIEAIALPTISGVLAVSSTTFLAAVSGPFADRLLNSADRALGFDFPSLIEFYRAHPDIATASWHIYFSFNVQVVLIPALLAMANQRRTLWIYLNGWCIALYTAVIVFPFFPAAGPFDLYGIHQDVFPTFKRFYPWETGPTIEALRNGSLRGIDQAARGLISIPSFHTIAAVFFGWAGWRSIWLRWPLLLLNLAMIASTIVTGAHYLIDILAGLVVAALALLAATRIVRRLEPGTDPG